MQPDLRDLIGIPFVDGGRDPATGLDCWGLCRLVLRRFGVEAPDIRIVCYDALRIGILVAGEEQSGRWERSETAEPGCVVLMAIDPLLPGICQHTGVCIGGGRFIHTLEKRHSSVARIDDRFFGRKIKGYYRWKG